MKPHKDFSMAAADIQDQNLIQNEKVFQQKIFKAIITRKYDQMLFNPFQVDVPRIHWKVHKNFDFQMFSGDT